MTSEDLDQLPGFRRRFLVNPRSNEVIVAVEDDYHCMAVTLHHDGVKISKVEAHMDRVPWTTCPGAEAKLASTFGGEEIDAVSSRGEKQANCTHLYDLVILGAAHARDQKPSCFDILVCDRVDGLNVAEIRRDGEPILRFAHRDNIMLEPSEVNGISLFKLRSWIDTLDAEKREAARLLQWGTILAHGRVTPMDQQSDASRMPPNCYTFQPDMAANAVRVGKIVDFGAGQREPLSHFDGLAFTN